MEEAPSQPPNMAAELALLLLLATLWGASYTFIKLGGILPANPGAPKSAAATTRAAARIMKLWRVSA